MPAVGLDISGGGLCLLTQEPLPAGREQLNAVVLVANRPVPISGSICWRDIVSYRGRPHYRYGLRFTAINDSDWEHIMEFAVEEAHGDAAPALGSTLTQSQCNVLIPYLAQRRIAEELVRAGRLDQPRSAGLALVAYRFDGYAMRQGVPYLRLTVRSRRTIFSTISEFSTKVLVPLNDPKAAPVLLS